MWRELLQDVPEIMRITEEERAIPEVALFTVTYLSDTHPVKALLAIPDQNLLSHHKTESLLPALLYCRGGYKKVGRVQPLRISQMAAFGYVIVAPHYRGNEGASGKDEFGGAELEDVYQAYFLLASIPFVDTNRIHLYGFSRGGMMALRAAMLPNRYASVVVWSGVSDMRLTYAERQDLRPLLKKIMGDPDVAPQAYDSRSPVRQAEQITCPVLIIHGQVDENVGVEHATRLAKALDLHHKPHELWLVEDESHLFTSEQIGEYTKAMFRWLESISIK
ncbi:prolyl oligopeptidase family serine peptidase [Brevibacillus laterosporus]|uniref:alpha/beta hydrolase family protein n=1 Tax=Brevibacillus laterosporus TaxID=1465 RepID=UPI00035EA079|nr:prolyl oligopeptidase family serine peptidase [Brevibacillus laterosporus]ATO48965.1 alpha/beta hydrolase [Brevibacillus laterosporus DSM 25]MBG9803280.1 peptidase [Brevibacillus laterosporus]MED2001868.1 prolyl oligopeptidase family serine peptidase [Brevibacillus laterosporus]MED4765958.1 prolyl oligopeptidase family serine peptidase [Brevibacillus laterosporus]TPH09169.1 S9 family peptidase [Brevibacillus laterosporus]